MDDRQRGTLLRERTGLRTVIYAVVFGAIGALLMWIAENWDLIASRESLRILVQQTGGLLVASVALGLLWELRGKRLLLDEVLDRMQISASLRSAGLRSAGNHYLHDFDWRHHLATARDIDFFFAYANTWRNAHVTELKALARRKGVKLRVILPDRRDPEILCPLARRFGVTAEELDSRIAEAELFFRQIKDSAIPEVEVHVYRLASTPVYTSYRFDQIMI